MEKHEKMNTESLLNVLPDKVMQELPLVITKFELNTPLRLSHFLSQCSHESMNFKVAIENLNYSSDGLLKIFPKYFNQLQALSYARKPEKIASKVYANRMGNGDELSGDGWRYRGRGYIQLTGKNNYALFNAFVDEDIIELSELVSSKYALLSAAWFFHVNQINLLSDLGNYDDVIKKVTKKINGGDIGLADRIDKFKKYYAIIK